MKEESKLLKESYDIKRRVEMVKMKNGIFRVLTLLLVFGLFVVFSNSSWAQQKDALYGTKGLRFGGPEMFAELHGFVNGVYKDFEGKPDKGGQSTFDLNHLWLAALAKVHPRVTIFGEVEYEHAGKDTKKLSIVVDRAFIDWRVIDRYLTLRLGTFNPPIGTELRDYVPPIRKFWSRPFYVDEVLLHEWVDAGVRGMGSAMLVPGMLDIEYDIAVINGPRGLRSDDQNNNDNNQDRTFVGRIGFLPQIGEYSMLELGISYAKGNYDDASQREFKITVLDAKFNHGGFEIRGEYAKRSGDDQTVDPPATLESDGTVKNDAPFTVLADVKGYYLQTAYKVIQNQPSIHYLEPLIRYDWSEGTKDDRSVADGDEWSRITFGINYSPYPHYLVRAEYQIINEDKVDKDNNGFALSAVVDF
ncbi:MAG: porin [Nitrospirota bacterium]